MSGKFSVKVHGETKEFENNLKNINSSLKMLKGEARGLDKSLKMDPDNTQKMDGMFNNLTQQLKLTKAAAEKTKETLANIDPQVDMSGFVAASNRLTNLTNQGDALENRLKTLASQKYDIELSMAETAAIENKAKQLAEDAKVAAQRVLGDGFTIEVHGETQAVIGDLNSVQSSLGLLKSEATELSRSISINPGSIENIDKLYNNVRQQLTLTEAAAEQAKVKLNSIDPKVDMSGFVAASNDLLKLENESVALDNKLTTLFDKKHNIEVSIADSGAMEAEARNAAVSAEKAIKSVLGDGFTIEVYGETQEVENSLEGVKKSMGMLEQEASSLNEALKLDPQNTQKIDSLYVNLEQQLKLTEAAAAQAKDKLNEINPKVNMEGFVEASAKFKSLENDGAALENKLSELADKKRLINLEVDPVDGVAAVAPIEPATRDASNKVATLLGEGFNKASGFASKAGSMAAKAFTAPFKMVGGMMKEIGIGALREIGSNITNSVGGALGDVKSGMQETQTSANGLKKVMTFQGVDQDYAKLSGELSKIAVNTNISTADANTFASTLIGVGKSASESSKLVQAAATANQSFGGSGENFQSVSTALAQMSSTGKVTAEDMNQITNANSALGASLKSEILENYKKAGGEMDSFAEAMAAGEISVDDMNNALLSVSTKGGEAIATLPDSMDSLKEAIGSKMQPAFDSITTSLAGVVGKTAEWVASFDISGITEKLTSFDFGAFFANLGSIMQASTAVITEVLTNISTIFEELTGKPLTFQNAFGVLTDFLTEKVTTILGYATQLQTALSSAFSTVSMDSMKESVSGTFNILKELTDLLVNVVADAISKLNLGSVINLINEIVKSIGSVVTSIEGSGILDTVVEIVAGVINVISEVSETIMINVNKILKAFEPVLASLKPVFEGLSNLFKSSVEAFKDFVNPVIDLVGDLIAVFVEEMGPSIDKFSKAIEPILTSIGQRFELLGEIFKSFVGIAKKVLIPVFELIGKAIGVILDVITKVIEATNKVRKFGDNILDKLSGMFGNGTNIDANVKNFKSDVNNSTTINENNATINLTAQGGMDLESLAEIIAIKLRGRMV